MMMHTVFVMVLALVLLSTPRPVAAAEAEGDGKATVSEAAYKVLTEARALITKHQPREAIERLKTLLPKLGEQAYALAVTHQVLGYAYSEQDDYRQAAESFKKAIAYQALPEDVTHNLRYNLAQILVQLDHYQEGLSYLEEWFRHEPDPGLDALKLAATAYFHLRRYDAAVGYLRKVLGRQPEEAWYQMLLACHLELGRNKAAASLLETMIKTYPERREYWLQLTGVYQRLDQNHKTLAVLALAERRGLLGEPELLQLARLYAYQEMPYQAAQFLEAKLKSGAIKRSLEVWDLLAQSWIQAQEKHRAVQALEQAGRLAADGNRHLQMAHVLFDLQDWKGVAQAVETALQKGAIKQTGAAHLLLGIASHHSGDTDRCRSALERAQRYSDTKAQAGWWLEKLRAEGVAATNGAPHPGL